MARVLASDEGGILASVRLPTAHPRLAPGVSLSSVVVVEVFRQGAFLLAHRVLDVPLTWHFITAVLRLRWLTAPPRMPHRAALNGVLSVRATVQTRKGQPYRVHWFLTLCIDGTDTVAGEFEGYVLEERDYRLLRRSATRRSTELHTDGAPVAVATPAGFEIHWDETDQFIFRRPSDHVVSMALVDATESAIALGAHAPLAALEMEFPRFAEHDTPILCVENEGEDNRVRTLTFQQEGSIVAIARVTLGR